MTDASNLLIVLADSDYQFQKPAEKVYADATQLAQVQKGSDPEDLKFLADN